MLTTNFTRNWEQGKQKFHSCKSSWKVDKIDLRRFSFHVELCTVLDNGLATLNAEHTKAENLSKVYDDFTMKSSSDTICSTYWKFSANKLHTDSDLGERKSESALIKSERWRDVICSWLLCLTADRISRVECVIFAAIAVTGIVNWALQLNKLIGQNWNGKLRIHSIDCYYFENDNDHSHALSVLSVFRQTTIQIHIRIRIWESDIGPFML